MCILLLQTATSCWEMRGYQASSPSCTARTASVIYPAIPGMLLLVPQIDPSVPQPVVQSRRRPLLGTFKTLLRHY